MPQPSPDQVKFRDDCIALLRRHTMSGAEMLAAAAHLTGQIVALQDANMRKEEALRIIGLNIELGSREAAAVRTPFSVPVQ